MFDEPLRHQKFSAVVKAVLREFFDLKWSCIGVFASPKLETALRSKYAPTLFALVFAALLCCR